jgi:hypothetical protein
MKHKKVGIYSAGSFQVELLLREGFGGNGDLAYEYGKIPIIQIGADHEKWVEIISILLHEIGELIRLMNGSRFTPDNNYSINLSACWFMYDHQQFTDYCSREAIFLAEALSDLADAWKLWKKNEKKKK